MKLPEGMTATPTDGPAGFATFEVTAQEVIHKCPSEGNGGVMPCCGMTPFEVPRWHRLTLDPAAVSCDNKWRLAEWQALPDVCGIAGCDTAEADQRGPVYMRDGSIHKVCPEHWELIMRVLGEQGAWEREAMRSGG